MAPVNWHLNRVMDSISQSTKMAPTNWHLNRVMDSIAPLASTASTTLARRSSTAEAGAQHILIGVIILVMIILIVLIACIYACISWVHDRIERGEAEFAVELRASAFGLWRSQRAADDEEDAGPRIRTQADDDWDAENGEPLPVYDGVRLPVYSEVEVIAAVVPAVGAPVV